MRLSTQQRILMVVQCDKSRKKKQGKKNTKNPKYKNDKIQILIML